MHHLLDTHDSYEKKIRENGRIIRVVGILDMHSSLVRLLNRQGKGKKKKGVKEHIRQSFCTLFL